jgi:hypothetical protein
MFPPDVVTSHASRSTARSPQSNSGSSALTGCARPAVNHAAHGTAVIDDKPKEDCESSPEARTVGRRRHTTRDGGHPQRHSTQHMLLALSFTLPRHKRLQRTRWHQLFSKLNWDIMTGTLALDVVGSITI